MCYTLYTLNKQLTRHNNTQPYTLTSKIHNESCRNEFVKQISLENNFYRDS